MLRERVFQANAAAIQRSVDEEGHGSLDLEGPRGAVWLESEASGTRKDSRKGPEAITINNLGGM